MEIKVNISPLPANPTIEPLQVHNKEIKKNSTTQIESTKIESLGKRISNCYREAIRTFVRFLQRHNFFVTSLVLGTLLLETGTALRAGFCAPASWKKHFNFYNMNPKAITEEQSKKSPILLIHGNYHNQSAWLSLAKKLKDQNLGPVYTVNLPNGNFTDKDFEITFKKIEEIKRHYSHWGVKNIKIDLVGHSRGGAIATLLSTERYVKSSKESSNWGRYQNDFGKVIHIGNVFDNSDISYLKKYQPELLKRHFEIVGKYDVLEDEPSQLDDAHKLTVDTGHLGLLYSKTAHDQLISWLKG